LNKGIVLRLVIEKARFGVLIRQGLSKHMFLCVRYYFGFAHLLEEAIESRYVELTLSVSP
jgi:hypothetical protein